MGRRIEASETPDPVRIGTDLAYTLSVANDGPTAAAAVTANGGTVVVPASDIPGVGRFAVALDPDGAQFAVIASVPA